jgi:hypothetical protein
VATLQQGTATAATPRHHSSSQRCTTAYNVGIATRVSTTGRTAHVLAHSPPRTTVTTRTLNTDGRDDSELPRNSHLMLGITQTHAFP